MERGAWRSLQYKERETFIQNDLSYGGIIMKNACFALLCFLCCPNGVLVGTGWEKRINVTIKVGENVTLQLPVNDIAVGEIKEVQWTKESNVFLQISKDKRRFLNKKYESIICSCNVSWITICNGTGNNTGLYTAHIKYRKESNKQTRKETYYVTEDPYFCGGTTDVSRTEGQAAHLHVKGLTNARIILWSKDNVTDILANTSNNSENGRIKMSGNGTLSINNLTTEDEGTYTVNIEPSDALLECNHTYTLSILSFGVKASTYSPLSGTQIGIIVFGIAAVIAIALTVFCIYKCKTEDLHVLISDGLPVRIEKRNLLNSNSHQNGVRENEEEASV